MSNIATRMLNDQYSEQRFLLNDVSWDTYVTVGKAFADRPALRLTFDRGRMEFFTPSFGHEMDKKWLARLIEIVAEETGRDFESAGNMTFQREDLDRGLEADDCFWIAQVARVRGKPTWEPDQDPPPDLALEIEVTRSALNRMGIYAALRVPEVWRYNGVTLRVYCLGADNAYHLSERSLAFPEVAVNELVRFIKQSKTDSALEVIRAFREWLRRSLDTGV